MLTPLSLFISLISCLIVFDLVTSDDDVTYPVRNPSKHALIVHNGIIPCIVLEHTRKF